MPNLGPTEIILILLVLVLLFGAKKLPELARGSGRALRIFKAETKGLMDDDDDDKLKTEEQRQIDSMRVDRPVEQPHPQSTVQPTVQPTTQPTTQPTQPTGETDR
jgi:sec-independent protein translocase protein TatA